MFVFCGKLGLCPWLRTVRGLTMLTKFQKSVAVVSMMLYLSYNKTPCLLNHKLSVLPATYPVSMTHVPLYQANVFSMQRNEWRRTQLAEQLHLLLEPRAGHFLLYGAFFGLLVTSALGQSEPATSCRWGSILDDVERTARYVALDGDILSFTRIFVIKSKGQKGGNRDLRNRQALIERQVDAIHRYVNNRPNMDAFWRAIASRDTLQEYFDAAQRKRQIKRKRR